MHDRASMPSLPRGSQVFVSDGSKPDIGRLQVMFGANHTVTGEHA